MLLNEITEKLPPSLRGPAKMQILGFALAHRSISKAPSDCEPTNIEQLKSKAARAAATLKNAPFSLSADVIARIISDPDSWIDEIYDSL